MKTIITIFLFFASVFQILAIEDKNGGVGNGMSDVWEKYYNGDVLFSLSNPDHEPTANPDGDGWTNAEEALAGTDPFDPAPPEGWVKTEITYHPAAEHLFIIKFPTFEGKVYKLYYSPDLVNWVTDGETMLGDGTTFHVCGECLYEDESGHPASMFWRVKISDDDPDNDNLTTWEELQLGYNPNHEDTDLDGIRDDVDAEPLASATLADPDGLGLPSSLDNQLRGFWDFESAQGFPFNLVYPDRSGANRDANGFSISQHQLGMLSKAADMSFNQYLTIPNSTIQGQAHYTISGWFKLEEGAIENATNGFYRAICSVYDRAPNHPTSNAPIGQGNVLLVRKNTGNPNGGEIWFIGGYQQTVYFNEPPFSNGNPKTVLNGYTFNLPAGTTDDGKWHHFTITRSPGSLGQKLFIDGEKHIEEALREFPVSFDADTKITFGRLYDQHSPSNFSGAHLDRLRVHGRVLADTEVLELYHQDIDNDGLWDITETRTRLWRDTDGDAVMDSSEFEFITSPFEWQFPGTDSDGDGATDLMEQTYNTNAGFADSDGDFLPDGWEILYGLDPHTSNATDTNGNGSFEPDEYTNSDDDDLTDLEEFENQTDPTKDDTDGDGVNDDVEVDQHSDPNDPNDKDPVPADERFSVLVGVGDESGSESEDYILNCFEIDAATGSERKVKVLRSGGYGEYDEKTYDFFRKDRSYSFQIDWQGTNNNSQSGSGSTSPEGADFDYTFKVQPGANSTGILVDSFIPSGHQLDWNNGILGQKDNVDDFLEVTEKKRVLILNPKLSWGNPVEEWPDIAGLDGDPESDLTIDIDLRYQALNEVDIISDLHNQGHHLRLYSQHHLSTGTPTTTDLIDNADQAFRTNGGVVRAIFRTSTLRTLMVTQQDEDDNVDEFASCDTASLTSASTDASNLTDSARFDADMAALGGENRGPSIGDGDIASDKARANDQFMRHGGVNPVWYTLGSATSEKRLLREQVDWLYYSGHGLHGSGTLATLDKNFAASDTIWTKDLYGVIIAGCSVLDIGDYRARSFGLGVKVQWRFKGGASSPGAAWADRGPRYLLGYCWRAPLDNQGSETIIADFISHYAATNNVIEAWKIANDKGLARNACLIDTGVTPHQYWYWDEQGGAAVWTAVNKGPSGW